MWEFIWLAMLFIAPCQYAPDFEYALFFLGGCIIDSVKCPWQLPCLLAVVKRTICLQSQPKLWDQKTLSFVHRLINRSGVDIHQEIPGVLSHSRLTFALWLLEFESIRMSLSDNFLSFRTFKLQAFLNSHICDIVSTLNSSTSTSSYKCLNPKYPA